jgi:hypothetical protein
LFDRFICKLAKLEQTDENIKRYLSQRPINADQRGVDIQPQEIVADPAKKLLNRIIILSLAAGGLGEG